MPDHEQRGLFPDDHGPTVFRGGQKQPDPLTLARRGHPEPSHDAAEAIVPHVGDIQQRALESVRSHPRRTVSELAAIEGLRDPRQFGRRMNELQRKGLIRQHEVRRCEVTRRMAGSWEVV